MKGSPDRSLLVGVKAKQMFGDMAEMMSGVVDLMSESLVSHYAKNEDAWLKQMAIILNDSRKLERILNALKAGDTDEAERLINEAKR